MANERERERVVYRRFMTFQQVMTTQNGRLCKKVIENQKTMEYKQCRYSEIKDDAGKCNIDIDETTNMKKGEWKRIVKRKIRGRIEKQSIKKGEKIPNCDTKDIKNMKDRST